MFHQNEDYLRQKANKQTQEKEGEISERKGEDGN